MSNIVTSTDVEDKDDIDTMLEELARDEGGIVHESNLRRVSAWFYLQVGAAQDVSYWDKCCSLMAHLSALYLGSLRRSKPDAADRLEKNCRGLPHPHPWLYEEVDWTDKEGSTCQVFRLRHVPTLKSTYDEFIVNLCKKLCLEEKKFLTWEVVKKRIRHYKSMMGIYLSANPFYVHEVAPAIHERIGYDFKMEGGSRDKMENKVFILRMQKRFKNTRKQIAEEISEQTYEKEYAHQPNASTRPNPPITRLRAKCQVGVPPPSLVLPGQRLRLLDEESFQAVDETIIDKDSVVDETEYENSVEQTKEVPPSITLNYGRAPFCHGLQGRRSVRKVGSKASPRPGGNRRWETVQQMSERKRKRKSPVTFGEGEESEENEASLTWNDIPLLSSLSEGITEGNILDKKVMIREGRYECPYTMIEIWRDEAGAHVHGPDDNEFRIVYPNAPSGSYLAHVYILPTFPLYVYIFDDPDANHHGVVSYEFAQNMVNQYMSNQINFTLLHSLKTQVIPDEMSRGQSLPFIILPAGDAAFDKHFRKMRLNPVFWVDQFTNLVVDHDKLRGVRSIDLGFSGGQSHESAAQTQLRGEEYNMAKPDMVGKCFNEHHRQVGSILECLHDATMDYCSNKKGGKVMQNELLEEEFAEPFRKRCGAKRFKWHACTVVWQLEGELVWDEYQQRTTIKYSFEFLKRHKDGRNMKRDGWTNTAIFSIKIVVGKLVYRMTVIAYTRNSTITWLEKDRAYVGDIVNALLKYKREKNGGIGLEEFWVSDTNDHLRIRTSGDGMNANSWIVSCKAKSTMDAEEDERTMMIPRLMESNENGEDGSVAQWENYQPKPDISDHVVKFIHFAELTCRCTLDSIKAWAINRLSDQQQLERRNRIELMWTGLCVNSPQTFVYVLMFWLNGGRAEDHDFEFNNNSVMLLDEFYYTCNYFGIQVLGGENCRWTAAGEECWPTQGRNAITPEEYDINLKLLEEGISDLEDGTLYRNGSMAPMGVAGVGNITRLSFPSLCLFTELAKPTDDAITRAITAEVNMNHCTTLWEDYCPNKTSFVCPSKQVWKSIYSACGNKLGTDRSSDMEQFACIKVRKFNRADVVAYGQDMMVIDHRAIKLKLFGTDEWTDFAEARKVQKLAARCPLHIHTKEWKKNT